jgi:hypothetical protein
MCIEFEFGVEGWEFGVEGWEFGVESLEFLSYCGVWNFGFLLYG